MEIERVSEKLSREVEGERREIERRAVDVARKEEETVARWGQVKEREKGVGVRELRRGLRGG